LPWERGPLSFSCPRTHGQIRRKNIMYLNRLTLIGFTGGDAETKTDNNGVKFTVLSVATEAFLEERK
jgi:hypothetical protein